MTPKSSLPIAQRVCDMPLWRLLVALDDAERCLGPDSDTAAILADEIQQRLRTARLARPEEVRDA
jgi:hypothetical protein